MILRIVIGLSIFCLANLSVADEIRPGYLELKEESQNTYSVLWKVPQKSGQKLLLEPRFPQSCTKKEPGHFTTYKGCRTTTMVYSLC